MGSIYQSASAYSASRYRMFEAERRNDDGADRVPRFDLDPLPSQRQWGHLSSTSSSSNEDEYWKHHSHIQEPRKKQQRPSFTPTPTTLQLLSSSNRDGWRASEPERRRLTNLTLRPPRLPPPLDPNLAPAANYLKSRFGPNPFPYPDPEDNHRTYFPASSGKLLAVKPRSCTTF